MWKRKGSLVHRFVLSCRPTYVHAGPVGIVTGP